MVVFLSDFDKGGLSLSDFILKSLSPTQIAKAQLLASMWAAQHLSERPPS